MIQNYEIFTRSFIIIKLLHRLSSKWNYYHAWHLCASYRI